MKKTTGKFIVFWFAFFAFIQLNSAPAHSDVNVFAEGAYTADTLVVYIYTDTKVGTVTELRSAGVKLAYDTSELTLSSAEKNESVWFLGGEAYMEPEISTPGEVVFILGKLDPADPAAGVSGDRVLLGKVTFTRAGTTTAFGLGLDLGKHGVEEDPPGSGIFSFKNFVKTDGNVLDEYGVSFGSISVYERGDANGDGSVTNIDMGTVRNLILGSGGYRVYADANGDGMITNVDMGTVRNIILGN